MAVRDGMGHPDARSDNNGHIRVCVSGRWPPSGCELRGWINRVGIVAISAEENITTASAGLHIDRLMKLKWTVKEGLRSSAVTNDLWLCTWLYGVRAHIVALDATLTNNFLNNSFPLILIMYSSEFRRHMNLQIKFKIMS